MAADIRCNASRGRRSAVRSKLPDTKRAIVTLSEGEIEIFQAG